jgi:hypothetical protein
MRQRLPNPRHKALWSKNVKKATAISRIEELLIGAVHRDPGHPAVQGGLELRFRSSHDIAATSDANFGIKGAPATY